MGDRRQLGTQGLGLDDYIRWRYSLLTDSSQVQVTKEGVVNPASGVCAKIFGMVFLWVVDFPTQSPDYGIDDGIAGVFLTPVG